MKSIEIHSQQEEPEELHRYPDFLLTALLNAGPGKIESVRSGETPTTDLVLTPRVTGLPTTVLTATHGHFRAILARLGFRLGDSPYSTHSIFSVKAEYSGQLRNHIFAFYLCNEPTMDFWVRIYLYGIEGMWPNQNSESQQTDPSER